MTNQNDVLEAPSWLSAAAAAWWRDMFQTYSFDDDPAGRELLTSAATQLDRMIDCRDGISDTGVTVVDRFGQRKANPLLVEERAASNLFRLLCRELGLSQGENESVRINRGY